MFTPFKTTLAAIAIMSLTACYGAGRQQVPSEANTAADSCDTKSVSQDCIIAAAGKALSGIVDPEDRVSAASEFALALGAVGDRQQAIAILDDGAKTFENIAATEARLKAVILIASSYSELESPEKAIMTVDAGKKLVQAIKPAAKQMDMTGKLASVRAQAGQIDKALSTASAMTQLDRSEAAFKARTLREIAVHQADRGDFSGSRETLAKMTMGLTYYQSTARSDIAALAFAANRKTLAVELLIEAEKIANAQDDGYFVAGALRDIAQSYHRGGHRKKALHHFEAAKSGAKESNSYQEKARSLSRVGTGMADSGLYIQAAELFPQAIAYADQAKSESFKNFSYYEIAGSAAFAGDFETAFRLVDEIPAIAFGDTGSLKAATQRDVAWGLARHDRLQDALELANQIAEPRELVQALSRIVRLLQNPGMDAFSRYL